MYVCTKYIKPIYTQILSHLPVIKAGPKVRAGLSPAPVKGIYGTQN